MTETNQEDTQIYFFVEEPVVEESIIEEEVVVRGGERGGGDRGGGWGQGQSRGQSRSRVDAIRAVQQKRVGLKSSVLKTQLQEMKNVIDELFDQEMQPQPAQHSTVQVQKGLQLEEITLSVSVNAKGELGILGTGGELGGSGGIILKFVRPKS